MKHFKNIKKKKPLILRNDHKTVALFKIKSKKAYIKTIIFMKHYQMNAFNWPQISPRTVFARTSAAKSI